MDDYILHFRFHSENDENSEVDEESAVDEEFIDVNFTPDVVFYLNNKFFSIKFSCSQYGINPNQWQELIDAAKTGNKYTLSFFVFNGNISIDVNDDLVCFNIGRYGGYNSGEMSLTLNSKLCIHAFQEAHDALSKYNAN